MDIFEEDAKKTGYRGYQVQVAEITEDFLSPFLDKKVTGEVTQGVRQCAKWCGVIDCGVFEAEDGELVRDFKPDYGRLMQAGIGDGDVDCLEGAEFLFAVEKVKSSAGYEFAGTCERFVRFWRKRLAGEAWRIVGEKIKEGLKEG